MPIPKFLQRANDVLAIVNRVSAAVGVRGFRTSVECANRKAAVVCFLNSAKEADAAARFFNEFVPGVQVWVENETATEVRLVVAEETT